MKIFLQKLKISLKNTLPTYILISIFTLLFLTPGATMLSFSRFGESLLEKILFSLAFNLLYFFPQFFGIFIGLHLLKKRNSKNITPEKAKWFLRVPTPATAVMTSVLIVLYFVLGFFPDDVNLMQLYIIFIIIIILNIMFSVIMTINVYTMMKTKIMHIKSKK